MPEDSTLRQYEVTVTWDGEDHSSVHTARSPSAARYARYVDLADAWDGFTFREYLKMVKSVRLTDRRTPYDYIRERYGVEFAVGQRVSLAGGRSGIVAEPPSSNPRASYVYVVEDGHAHPRPWHPGEVTP